MNHFQRSFNSLPIEILGEVLSFLSNKEVLTIGLSNTSWHKTSSHPVVWNMRSINRFGREDIKKLDVFISPRLEGNWLEIYKLFDQLCTICHRNYREIYKLFEFYKNAKVKEKKKIKNLFSKYIRESKEELFELDFLKFKEKIQLIQRFNEQKVHLRKAVFRGKVVDGLFEKGELMYNRSENLGEKSIKIHSSFYKNKMQGKGQIYFPNGTIYNGGFRDGLMNGYGEYYWLGGYYKGNFRNNQFNGNGVMFYRNSIFGDSTFYEGEFRDSKRNGFGKMKKGTVVYEGFFENDSLKKGILFSNSYIFDGVFTVEKKKSIVRGKKIFAQFRGSVYSNNFLKMEEGNWIGGINTERKRRKSLVINFGNACANCMEFPIMGKEKYYCNICRQFSCKKCCKYHIHKMKKITVR